MHLLSTEEKLGKIGLGKKEANFSRHHPIVQGRGKRYDFLVPLMGGRDSTYVLYYLTKGLGASRVLAFTWDQIFHRKFSWTNMASAVDATGVDFQVYRIIDAETTRVIIRAFFRRFGYTCMACRVFLSPVIGGMAIRDEIPLIVTGENPGQAYMRDTHEKSGPVSVLQDVANPLATVRFDAQGIRKGHARANGRDRGRNSGLFLPWPPATRIFLAGVCRHGDLHQLVPRG